MRSTSTHPLNVKLFPQSIFPRNKIKKKAKHKNIKSKVNFLFGHAEFIVEVKRRKGKTIAENDFATEKQRRAQTWAQG